jgi:hypothetical protein
MSCRGVHFSLSEEEVRALRAFDDDSDRLDYVQCEIEEKYFADHEDRLAESDKAWEAIHRALADGDLSYTTGPYPLRLAVVGGESIYGEDDYIMTLKTPAEVKAIAPALSQITKVEFRKKYEAIDAKKYAFPKSAKDFEYTWEWLVILTAFYQQAAEEGRWVLFSVDQ